MGPGPGRESGRWRKNCSAKIRGHRNPDPSRWEQKSRREVLRCSRPPWGPLPGLGGVKKRLGMKSQSQGKGFRPLGVDVAKKTRRR
eukprot:4667403-Pyramimonas_sp.AAC.1